MQEVEAMASDVSTDIADLQESIEEIATVIDEQTERTADIEESIARLTGDQ